MYLDCSLELLSVSRFNPRLRHNLQSYCRFFDASQGQSLLRSRAHGISDSTCVALTRSLQRPETFFDLTDAASVPVFSLHYLKNLLGVMSLSTQDLIVFFCSFGVACFALNIYKLTQPAKG